MRIWGLRKDKITGQVTCPAAGRGFEPGCLTPLSHISTSNLSVLKCIHSHLWSTFVEWQPQIRTCWVDCLAGYFYFFHLGRTESKIERHLQRSLAILILQLRDGRVWGFIFKHIPSWWETLFSFCAYDAAKLSPGFISKRKEAAKIAILML